MLRKWFGQKQLVEVIAAPITGKGVPLEEVPDPTFAQKMLGDGVAIFPKEGLVVAPVNGEVVQMFPTKHAFTIRSEQGLEILIHIGLETVRMNGEGFEAKVSVGSKVKKGEPLVQFSLDLVREKAKDIITPVVILNRDKIASLDLKFPAETIAGETEIMTVTLKS